MQTSPVERGAFSVARPFCVGDKAVYPAHGVAEVTGIENREISGSLQTFYILRILDSGLRIMIPTRNTSAVGLRPLASQSEVKEVYAILRARDIAIDTQTWNRRHREYMDKIRTGSLFEVAEVLRDLSLLKFDKDLSFGERKMLDTARGLLVKELAFACATDEAQIRHELEQIFTC